VFVFISFLDEGGRGRGKGGGRGSLKGFRGHKIEIWYFPLKYKFGEVGKE